MAQKTATNASATPFDVAQVQQTLQTLQQQLAQLLTTLSPEQRRTMVKMSDRTSPFVQKTLTYARNHPEFTPPYLDVAKMGDDLDRVQQLNELIQPMNELCQQLADSLMSAGSGAYQGALTYYNAVKQAAKQNQPAAQMILDDLQVQFNKTKAIKSASTTTKSAPTLD